jgi:hypothetical protein
MGNLKPGVEVAYRLKLKLKSFQNGILSDTRCLIISSNFNGFQPLARKSAVLLDAL